MKVAVRYLGTLASEAGQAVEDFRFDSPPSLKEVLAVATAGKSRLFERLVLDRRGEAQPFILVALDGKLVPAGSNPALVDGAEIVLAVTVSGG